MLYDFMANPQWFELLKEMIEKDGRPQRAISLAAGLGPNYVQQMVQKNQLPKPATIEKLLAILNPKGELEKTLRSPVPLPTSEVRLADVPPPLGMPKDVPVRGTVAASDYEKGAFQLGPDIVDYVRRPPGLLAARDVYALYVEGSSMLPKFDAGDLIYVNPNRPVRPGDYVVIQEPQDEDTIRGFVKQYVKRSGEWHIVQQFNPKGEMRFRAIDAVKIHRVLSTADMMGV